MGRRVILAIGMVGAAVTVTMLSIGLWWYVSGGRLLSVQTGSMKPTINTGDAVLVHKIDSATVQTGNVISYRSSNNVVVPVTHRVVAIDRARSTFTTKGDALESTDPEIRQSQLIGQVQYVAPGLGRVLAWLRKPYVLAVVVYSPVAMVALVQLRRLQVEWHLPTYHYRRRIRS